MAISTYKVFLMKGTGSTPTWAKLIDIKEFPDLGGAPEMLETTTLSDNMQTYIAGIQSLDGLALSRLTILRLTSLPSKLLKVLTLSSLSGLAALRLAALLRLTAATANSPSTVNSVYPVGGGVNEVAEMNITIAPSTPITFAAS